MWRSRSFLGLELKDDVFKIVELMKSGRGVRLERLVYERIPNGFISEGVVLEPKRVNELLGAAVAGEDFQTRKVHISIDSPHFQLITKTYPAMKKRHLRRVIASDIAEKMELSIEDPWYEVISLEKPDNQDEHSEWKVLIVVTSEAFVRSYVQLVRSSGLKPVGVDLSPLAVHRWLTYSRPADELAEKVLIVNLSSRGAHVSVIKENILTASHYVPLPAPSFSSGTADVKEGVRQYASRLMRSVVSTVGRDDAIGEWTLTGEGVPLADVRDRLREETNVRISVISGEVPVSDSLLYRPIAQLKPGLCLPMGLALKGLIRS